MQLATNISEIIKIKQKQFLTIKLFKIKINIKNIKNTKINLNNNIIKTYIIIQ